MKEIIIGALIGFLIGFLVIIIPKYVNFRFSEKSENETETNGEAVVTETTPHRVSEPLVLSSVSTNRYFCSPLPNHDVERIVIVRRRETYFPSVVKEHWVLDGNGNRVRFVESHVEYR